MLDKLKFIRILGDQGRLQLGRKSYVRTAATLLFGGLLLGTARSAAAQEKFESSQTLRASQILPPELLRGPNHGVEERVLNDGYLNHYKINSKFGQYTVVSTPLLRKRVHEINAIAELEKVRGTKEFMDSFKESGFKTLEGAKSLITSPVKTTVGVIGGIGAIFKSAGDNLFGHERSEAEESRLKDVIGFSKVKREYAYQFDVDVYSRNQPLQDRLDDLSWAGYAGGLSMSAALMPVGGGIGMAISVSRLSRLFNEIFRNTPPSELRRMNHEKLIAMGVYSQIADLFINNQVYTPRQQTLFVFALDEMKRTANRAAYVKFAVPAKTPNMTFFRQLQAEMYAGYSRNVETIERFEPFGGLVAARARGGKLVFNAPLDHLVWTESMGRFIDGANYRVNQLPWVKEKQLWVAGTVSPLAREQLTKRGWKVQEKSEAGLLDMAKSYPKYEKKGKTPSGTVEVNAKSVALGVGFSWGGGTLKFKGKEYAFSVEGLSLADVGYSTVSATGDVYDLKRVSDLAGTYAAMKATFALAGGKGDLTMRNGKGVFIHLRSAQAGTSISLGPSGVTIKMK